LVIKEGISMSIAQYLLRRLGLALMVVTGVLIVTFVVSRVVPSAPELLFAGPQARPETLAMVREKLGLDKPLPIQFARYVSDLAHGDFGVSYLTKRPILQDLKTFLPATLELVIPASLLAILVGIPVGVLSGAYRGKVFDQVSRIISISNVSTPSFWMALLLQMLFAGTLGLLPLGGRLDKVISILNPIKGITGLFLLDAAITGNWEAWKDALLHLVLPVSVLSLYPVALAIRMTRASMIEVLSEQYIRAAHAAGIPEHRILFLHALKNAIIPTLTVLGLSFAYSITGAFLVETVFSWPGVGRYVAEAIVRADFPVVMAVTLIVTLMYIIVNLTVDLIQVAIDPRIRLG
jgi:peptide/nickel transport system permease protein